MDEDDQQTYAGLTAGCTFMCLAIVGALKQEGLLEPENVARLAEWFATNVNHDATPVAIAAMQGRLREYAALTRSMATVPANAGRG